MVSEESIRVVLRDTTRDRTYTSREVIDHTTTRVVWCPWKLYSNQTEDRIQIRFVQTESELSTVDNHHVPFKLLLIPNVIL
jgi:hypothetical protein